MIRHGDLLLRPVAEIPNSARLQNTKVLAEGETTGHRHVLTGNAQIFKKGETLFVDSQHNAFLQHDEHKQVPVSTGKYILVLERELDVMGRTVLVED